MPSSEHVPTQHHVGESHQQFAPHLLQPSKMHIQILGFQDHGHVERKLWQKEWHAVASHRKTTYSTSKLISTAKSAMTLLGIEGNTSNMRRPSTSINKQHVIHDLKYQCASKNRVTEHRLLWLFRDRPNLQWIQETQTLQLFLQHSFIYGIHGYKQRSVAVKTSGGNGKNQGVLLVDYWFEMVVFCENLLMSCDAVKGQVIYVSKVPFAVPKIWAPPGQTFSYHVNITVAFSMLECNFALVCMRSYSSTNK